MALLKECLQKTECVSANWKLLGLILTVPKHRLDEIEKDKQFATDCRMEMLDTWLKGNPDSPLTNIDDALRELYKCLNRKHKSVEHLKLGEDTQKQIDCLQAEFAEIALEASECLQKKYPDAEKAGKWLNEVLRGIQDEPLMVAAGVTAVSHDDLFKHLQTRWSFTNPTNLEKLIRKLQTAPSSLQEKIKKYTKKFKEFCHSLSLDGNTQLHFETLDGKQPCLIIEMAAIEQDFDEILAFLQDVFGIYKRYFRIHKIEPGCIKITLQFPADMQQLIQGCIDQKCDALKQHAISMQIVKPEDRENPSVDSEDDSSEHVQLQDDKPNRTDRSSMSSPSCMSNQSLTSRVETNRNSSPPHPVCGRYVICRPFQEIIDSGSYESSNESDEEIMEFTNSDSSCHTSDFEEEMPPPLKRIKGKLQESLSA